MNTEWLVIFIPGPKSGLNLVAFHIYSWTSIWLSYLRLKSLKWIAVLDSETCIYILVRCYHYH